jgi:hypothetical protein
MAGNETLQQRAGANAPSRPNSKETGLVLTGRGRSVVLTDNGPDIEVVPQPDNRNKGRLIYLLGPGSSSFPSLGGAGAENGSALSGEVRLIDANGEEFILSAALGITDAILADVPANINTPGAFFCLQNGERIVYRPDAPNPNQRGLFFSGYRDTDAIGVRVPILSTSEVLVYQAPAGKYVAFPAVKKSPIVSVLCIAAGAGVTATLVEFFIVDVNNNRVKVGEINLVAEEITSMSSLTAPLSLAPGEKLVAVPDAAPGGNLTVITSVAILNAADEISPVHPR